MDADNSHQTNSAGIFSICSLKLLQSLHSRKLARSPGDTDSGTIVLMLVDTYAVKTHDNCPPCTFPSITLLLDRKKYSFSSLYRTSIRCWTFLWASGLEYGPYLEIASVLTL